MKLLLIAAMAVTLSGCAVPPNLTKLDGSAINSSPVCMDTANGRFCYVPTPVPGTAAVAPAPVVQAVPQLAK